MEGPLRRFHVFSELFADYPTLEQNKLSLDDGPPAVGEYRHSFYPADWPLTPQIGATATKAKSRPDGGPNHRPTRSEEDRRRVGSVVRPPVRRKNPPNELDIFASPEKNTGRKPRRNSESSVLEKPPMSEEERRRRERHRRERDSRYQRDSSKRESGHPRHSRRKPHGLDIIDKLDATGIYGAGCEFPTFDYTDSDPLIPTTASTIHYPFIPTIDEIHNDLSCFLAVFHHDGPFDACNPHRNRKKDHRAPMQAFPENSANMALGGSGPLNDRLDLNKIHGTGTEGYKDYGNAGYYDAGHSRRPEASRNISFDPYARAEPVHGEESFGLGTSTFLEGAPASRKAIERRESEVEAKQKAELVAGGLGRKKSIAQRLRGMSTGRAVRYGDGTAAAAIRSPDARPPERHNAGNGNGGPSQDAVDLPQVKARSSQSVGTAGSSKVSPVTLKDEPNPGDGSYDEAYDKKGAQIKVAEEKREEDANANDAEGSAGGRVRALSSPRKPLALPLERKAATDNDGDPTPPSPPEAGSEVKPSGGGSFLSRVKSLKGGKRPTRRPS